MDYRLSKLSKVIIYFNFLITAITAAIHGYNVYRLRESSERILAFMDAKAVSRDTAIRMLQKTGEDLFVNKEFSTYFGLIISIATLIFLYRFAKSNGFFLALSAAFCGLFCTFIGGLLLFYLIFSGRSEVVRKGGKRNPSDDWESFIHKKSNDKDATPEK